MIEKAATQGGLGDPSAAGARLGGSAPRSNGRITRPLGRFMLRLFGWHLEGGLVDRPQFVMIVAPHTSSWDFIHGLAAKWALGLRVGFVAKHTLFRFPFGVFLRGVGGMPVDRGATEGFATRVAALFATGQPLCIVITPEGTRNRVTTWKTGFHRIAVAAGVPILPVGFDYSTRAVRLLPFYMPTGDYATDLAALSAYFTPAMARHPEKYTPPTA